LNRCFSYIMVIERSDCLGFKIILFQQFQKVLTINDQGIIIWIMYNTDYCTHVPKFPMDTESWNRNACTRHEISRSLWWIKTDESNTVRLFTVNVRKSNTSSRMGSVRACDCAKVSPLNIKHNSFDINFST
jgi:hypothetical protein